MDDEADEARAQSQTHTLIWDVRKLHKPRLSALFKSTEYAIDHNMYIHNGLVFQVRKGSQPYDDVTWPHPQSPPPPPPPSDVWWNHTGVTFQCHVNVMSFQITSNSTVYSAACASWHQIKCQNLHIISQSTNTIYNFDIWWNFVKNRWNTIFMRSGYVGRSGFGVANNPNLLTVWIIHTHTCIYIYIYIYI